MDPRVSTPAIVLSHVPTLPPPNQHPTAQHHDPRARLLLHTRAISNITTIPLSVNKLHGSIPCTTVNKGIWSNLNCYLDSPAQAGRTYINNGCNPLQEFDPDLRSSMQGFVRHHPDQ
ncbi:hypothetical protein V8E54_003557 [Elaphomyces granulatus]